MNVKRLAFWEGHSSFRTLQNPLAGSNQDIVIFKLYLVGCISVCLVSLFENIFRIFHLQQ